MTDSAAGAVTNFISSFAAALCLVPALAPATMTAVITLSGALLTMAFHAAWQAAVIERLIDHPRVRLLLPRFATAESALPIMMTPGLTAILILRSADMLKMFDAVFTMTSDLERSQALLALLRFT